MINTLLDAQALCKVYDDTTALNDLSLQARAGEIVGLLGPNGAGKTTAIHIFLGLLSPTSGKARVLGLDPLHHRHAISQRINFCSAYVQLPSNLTVSENLFIFSKLYGVKKVSDKIRELLSLFDIAKLYNRKCGALSAGEKTRLNLVKCLLNDPELLLLDEPTASLDPEMADTVRQVLKKIRRERNIGILYTSHNMPEVEEICDRIYFINDGKMIAQGSPKEILAHFNSSSLDQVFIKIVRSGDLVRRRAE